MNVVNHFFLALNSIRQRKLRSWLTMIGIFIGVAAVVSLISIGQGLQSGIEQQFAQLGADKLIIQSKGVQGPPGSGTSLSNQLTIKDAEFIERVKGVDLVVGIIMKTAKVEHDDEIKFVFISGFPMDPEQKRAIQQAQNFKIIRGRDLEKEDKFKAVVGYDYYSGKVFGNKIDIRDKISVEGQDFKVVGILKRTGNPFDDSSIVVTKEVLRDLYNAKEEESIIYVQVQDVDSINQVAEDIEKNLRKSRGEKEGKETFEIRTPQQLLESFSNIFSIVQAVLVGIAAISLLVGGIGIMNTMYTSILERTKDIGIMKAVGARNSDILTLFLIESGLLGMFGGLIGIGIGLGLAKIVETIAIQQLGTDLLRASFSLELIFGALLFSFLVGAVSGVLPARQASRMKPVDALRYE